MVNSIADFNEAMRGGANAIEADVTFSHDGTAVKLFHGWPCDCLRECTAEEEVKPFLEYVRMTTSIDGGQYADRLALLFLDLKVGDIDEQRKYGAGINIAENLLQHLWQGVPFSQALNVLLSVPSVADQEVLQGAIDTISRYNSAMLDKIGFDVSNNDDLDNIRNMYERLGIERHRWQGDGITNCLSYLRSADRLQSVIDNRDSDGPEHYVEKAYDWTLDMPEEIRRSLRRGVDGIITNKPERMAVIMQEDEFKDTLRPANVSDNPWIPFVSSTPLPRLSTDDFDHLKDEDLGSAFDDAFSFLARLF
ncbi:dermonecrotic toxin SPH-like [Amblyomma americanum]